MDVIAFKGVDEELAATASVSVAEPDPWEAPERVILSGKAETAYVQEGVVWMVISKLPPVAGTCIEVGETAYAQGGPEEVRRRTRVPEATYTLPAESTARLPASTLALLTALDTTLRIERVTASLASTYSTANARRTFPLRPF